MVGAKEYLDSICPQRGNARRDLPDSENDEEEDSDSDEDDAEENDVDDRMDVDEIDNNNENEEERLINDKSGDFDDIFVNEEFQIRDVLKLKTVDERLDELFARSGTSFMKFSGIKKLAPRNTKEKELLSVSKRRVGCQLRVALIRRPELRTRPRFSPL